MTIDIPLHRGESRDFPQSGPGTTTHTIARHYRADLIGAVSSGAGRILVKPKDMPLAVRYLDVDMADNVTDLVHSDVKLAPGDEVTLTVDSGSAGFVLLRLQNARKA